jgi:hypothetical protein
MTSHRSNESHESTMNHTIQSLLIDTGLGDEIVSQTILAEGAHVDANRTATVTAKITIKWDKDQGCSVARGRVQCSLPQSDSDALTKKGPAIGLFQIGADHPGQATIEGVK